MRIALTSPGARSFFGTDRNATSICLPPSISKCATSTPPVPPTALFTFQPSAEASQPTSVAALAFLLSAPGVSLFQPFIHVFSPATAFTS